MIYDIIIWVLKFLFFHFTKKKKKKNPVFLGFSVHNPPPLNLISFTLPQSPDLYRPWAISQKKEPWAIHQGAFPLKWAVFHDNHAFFQNSLSEPKNNIFLESFNLLRMLLIALYRGTKTLIGFWYWRGLKSKSLIQPSEI